MLTGRLSDASSPTASGFAVPKGASHVSRCRELPANLDRHTVTPSPSRASFRPDTSPRSLTSSTRMVALSSPPSLCLGTPTIWLGG